MMHLFDHVRHLHDSELHNDLKTLASMVMSLCENTPDLFTLPQKYMSLVYYGDALYATEEHRKAEEIYRKALQLKKTITKTKCKISIPDMVSEEVVKYKLYLCHNYLKQHKEAMTVLESISAKQRTAKINLALAKLYQAFVMDRSAISCYKEVIRECPFAVEATQALLNFGVTGAEVAAIVMHSLPPGTNYDWLTSWIKGHAFLAVQEHPSAITTFNHMDSKVFLRDNVNLLCSLGEACFKNGDYTNALLSFQRAHALDPLNMKNMDLFGYILYIEKKAKELESLSTKLMEMNDIYPEPWIVLGYLAMLSKKPMKALQFSQRAVQKNLRSVQGFMLKGAALLELKKMEEAILHYREAITVAPYRFEAHKGLIDCYMECKRTREAITLASKAIKSLGTNARTLTLYASVLIKDPTMVSKAKPYLERAMKLDPRYLEPVYIMAEILCQEQQFDKGVELLRRTLQHSSTCKLHRFLGEFLRQTNEDHEALHQYNIALVLDPTNVRAREGIERVEKHSEMLEGSYVIEGSEEGDYDNIEGSDVESPWSETDFT